MSLADPIFPPLLTAHAVNAPLAPFADACQRAAVGELGAGDVVWSRRHDRAELALVLEPEIGAGTALQMAPLMLVAAGDCLGALLPPQVPVSYRWPDRLAIDGAEVGRLSLALAETDTAGAVPDWLVVGIGIQLAFRERDYEPGEVAHRTALAEEGGADIDRTRLLESISSHFMSWLNTWQDDGFRPVSLAFLERLDRDEDGTIMLEIGGVSRACRPLGLDEQAGLILKPQAGPSFTAGLWDALVQSSTQSAVTSAVGPAKSSP
jgi:BirA family biotin operon repressor/biotin-[acetyl-CoA-carboxylase] ligase